MRVSKPSALVNGIARWCLPIAQAERVLSVLYKKAT
jgi:hypothetical protein